MYKGIINNYSVTFNPAMLHFDLLLFFLILFVHYFSSCRFLSYIRHEVQVNRLTLHLKISNKVSLVICSEVSAVFPDTGKDPFIISIAVWKA